MEHKSLNRLRVEDKLVQKAKTTYKEYKYPWSVWKKKWTEEGYKDKS